MGRDKRLFVLMVLYILLVVPAVSAGNVYTTIKDSVHRTRTVSWSTDNRYHLSRTLSTSAGGTVNSVQVTIPWDGQAVASLIVLKHSRYVVSNAGNRIEFITAMGSAFFGKGSYHTFSSSTSAGYEEFWITPTKMVAYGGRTGASLTKTYTVSVYASSEVEAKAQVKAGFEILGLEASVEVTGSKKIGSRTEYTVTVQVSVYQHYYDTEYSGRIDYMKVVSDRNFTPTKKLPGYSTMSTSRKYSSKAFRLTSTNTFYTYEDIDLGSRGHSGSMVS